jgi:hypothetical protein
MYVREPMYFIDDTYPPSLQPRLSMTGRKKYFAASLQRQATDKDH